MIYGIAKAYSVGPGKRKSIAIVIPKLVCNVLRVTNGTHFTVHIEEGIIKLKPLLAEEQTDQNLENYSRNISLSSGEGFVEE